MTLYSGTWSSYLTDRRLVGALGERNYGKLTFTLGPPHKFGLKPRFLELELKALAIELSRYQAKSSCRGAILLSDLTTCNDAFRRRLGLCSPLVFSYCAENISHQRGDVCNIAAHRVHNVSHRLISIMGTLSFDGSSARADFLINGHRGWL